MMRVAFTVIFLGWWLSRKRWMTQGQHTEPSISVIPSGEIYPGENVIISCKKENYSYGQMTFVLVEQVGRDIKEKQRKQTENDEVNFSIIEAKKDDEGIYMCAYNFDPSYSSTWSDYSTRVHIRVRDQVYPKPSISISPNKMVALGEKVAIHCWAQEERPADFHLKRKGDSDLGQVTKTEENGTTFYIDNINHSDGGIYWCEYKSHEKNLFSYLSDPVQINITDPELSRPSIKGRIKSRDGGINVAIDCEGPEKGLTFSLFKANSWMGSQMSQLDKYGAQFSLHLMNFESEENYTCRYQDRESPFIWSEPSEPAQLIWENGTETIIWASISAGLLCLVLLLLLLAFILCRKRKTGSTASERNQPGNASLQPVTYTEPDEVSYAALNHSVKIRQTFVPEEVPESCVYASVAKDRTRKE